VQAELGHADAFERFHPYGPPEARRLARAVGPGFILHILSGNTPHAGLQSLVRGLLTGAENGCKLPRRGLPELERFREALPEALARRVAFSTELRGDWLEQADAVVVFGSDETVEALRQRVRADQRFIAHAHRLSFGIVFSDPAFESVPAAARSASLYNQQGCLSPHLFYVHPPIAREYAQRLAGAMAAYEKTDPRGEISLPEQGEIAAVRREFAFRAAMGDGAAVWESPGSTAWTVLYDPEPAFTASCLNRVVYVKPLPENHDALAAAVRPVRRHLSTAGIHPVTPENAERAALTGAPRLCPIAQMQFPPWTWHHDGQPVLLPLVRWVDFEGE
jgi:hypothetical protein